MKTTFLKCTLIRMLRNDWSIKFPHKCQKFSQSTIAINSQCRSRFYSVIVLKNIHRGLSLMINSDTCTIFLNLRCITLQVNTYNWMKAIKNYYNLRMMIYRHGWINLKFAKKKGSWNGVVWVSLFLTTKWSIAQIVEVIHLKYLIFNIM